MRYLSLGEALVIAEEVTGIPAAVLAMGSGVGLLDSALHAPQACFGGHEMYPSFVDKAAVLTVRIVRNHPLPDGNKRLAWSCLTMFCILNGHDLQAGVEDVVQQVLGAAAGEVTEEAMARWISANLRS